MGNENQKSEFDQDNWDIIAKIGDKVVLKNKLTFSLLDLHECEELSQSASSRKAEQILDWRKQRTIQQHIPVLYHYEVQRAMIGSAQKHKVFTEHITRLSQLPPFSKQQAFLIVEQIIEVLPLLYKHFGLFHANIYTVGVNDSGKVKVWINENFAKNYADEEDVIKNPSQNLELTIVNNLFRMVKTKAYINEAKPQYPFSLNFRQALKYIKESRQIYVEYALKKVYLNRDEFNQTYKASLGQNLEISPVKNELKVDKNQRNIGMQTLKTEISQSPRQYYAPVNTPIQNQYFPIQNTQQIIYYPINNAHFHSMPAYHQASHQMIQRKPQIINLNQNKIIQAPIPIIKQANRFLSPPKQQRRDISPSKFMKKINLVTPQTYLPKGQLKIQENLQQIPSPNRNISLSPSKRRDNRPPTVQKKEQEQQNWLRPASANKGILRRQLSRIIQQEQTKNDSFHMYHPQKGKQGFNVQLVESIYVKTRQTENSH